MTIRIFRAHPEISRTSNGTFVLVRRKDAIERANARLMGSVVPDPAGDDDIYARYQIVRPSREEIEEAGSRALSKLTPAG